VAVAARKAAEGYGEARRNETRGAPHPQARQRQYLQTSNPALRRMAYFSAFFLVFVFTARRRMAHRFYPTPCGMNVKRGSKPTAEPTKNQRKT
jgi:hypothetical protein